ncbi:hypothetical protein Q9Q99_07440 [Curtobacterium flaccumfaciens]|nr:hypothetical protein Q9Q99_07440 [Curtobacterium flaccumfaciens]
MTDHDGIRPDLPDSSEALDALEPGDLDGHSIDELTDYLDAGMQPADPSIDDSPACQNALAAIIRVRHASLRSLEVAAREEAPADESWISGVLANISIEARSGRDVPLRPLSETERPVMTEGAIRSLIRRTGDAVTGVLVARCQLEGDVTELASPVRVVVEDRDRPGPVHPDGRRPGPDRGGRGAGGADRPARRGDRRGRPRSAAGARRRDRHRPGGGTMTTTDEALAAIETAVTEVSGVTDLYRSRPLVASAVQAVRSIATNAGPAQDRRR